MSDLKLTDLTMDQLLSIPLTLKIEPPKKPKFYAHIDQKTLSIQGVSPMLSDSPDKINLEIEYDLAEKFLTGKENIFLWAAVMQKEEITLIKKQDLKFVKRERTDLLRLVEILPSNNRADIMVSIESDHLAIHYDGEKIKYTPGPIKLYVTGEQNPANLKFTFSLGVNILNKIVLENGLDQWPNPIRIPIDDPEDISIYAVKSNMTIAVNKNEAVHKRV